MFVRFRKPVPINTELLLRARLDDARGRRIHTTGTITDGNVVLAEARVALTELARTASSDPALSVIGPASSAIDAKRSASAASIAVRPRSSVDDGRSRTASR